MSIANLRKHLFLIKLTNSLNLMLLNLFLFLIVSILFQITPTANAECYAVGQNSSCSTLGKQYFLLDSSKQKCSTYLPSNTICCCTLDNIVTTKPKYLLISSVVAFFAILTGLVFFYKKNE